MSDFETYVKQELQRNPRLAEKLKQAEEELDKEIAEYEKKR
jgi:glucose-6-phosphate-specific signal transduction histidine kinase